MKYRLFKIFFGSIFIVMVFLALKEIIPYWIILVLFPVYIISILIVSTNVRFNFFLKAYNNNPDISENAVALSFDDGPNENTLKILGILKEHNVKAAFFCIGKKIEQHPDIFREIIAQGHIVGNHTYTHTRKMGFISSEKIQEEIELCNKIAERTAGVKMGLFRPPFGIINPKTQRALSKTGHKVIGWNLRPYDAITSSPERILDRITRKIKKGDVILLHDNLSKTSVILEQLLVILKQRNFRFIRPDNLFNIDAYN